MRKFFRRLLDPREHFRQIRKIDRKLPQALREIFSPFEHARDLNNKVLKPLGLNLGGNKRAAQEDTAAIEEANRQEADAMRQAQDHANNLQAQQSIMSANLQAEEALARAQEKAPIDRLDVVLGDSDSSTSFRFRNAASAVAGDPATFARKARAWLKR